MTAEIEFQEVQMPDGSPKGRKMWRASRGENYAAFYPFGRKGLFWVTWGSASGAGGERADGREDAESKATEILRRLAA